VGALSLVVIFKDAIIPGTGTLFVANSKLQQIQKASVHITVRTVYVILL
jgi:hypothetical protein